MRRLLPLSARTYLRRLLDAPTWLTGDLGSLPPLQDDIHPFLVREIDPGDPADLDRWLEIQSEAFGWRFGRTDAERLLLRHPLLEVRHTYLLIGPHRAIGAVSGAVFRERPDIASGHMAALRPHHQGRGFGRHLALHRYHALRADGLRACETESRLQHRQSILNHFSFGFRPKTRLDSWNGPDPIGPGSRLMVSGALRSMSAYAALLSRPRGRS